ncbi:MAG: 30S ribosomal protein S7 [Phycisphaerae bacterium]|nr:30S ribosomal protein S7 [Phycisphaerae bacterium]MDD5381076.1 30S ribosomal protein S7 [Phycisphaerae bacterium]
MAGKFTASGQQLKPDPVYKSKLVSKFINSLMWDGKKSVAQRAFYDAMEIIRRSPLVTGGSGEGATGQKTELEVFETAINNVKPLLEVRSKRIGGASYQIPMQVKPSRQQSLAFRWIIQSTRGKKGSAICQRLATELMEAYDRRGGAMTTRDNVHKMAEANKAFAHFAW